MAALFRAPTRPLRVLFVDPDWVSAESLIRAARLSAAAIVPSAAEALNFIRASMPDLLVTELALDDGSGIELIRYLHQTPATHNLLLIALTSRTSVADKVATFQAGADEYLVKPVDPEFFALRVRILMSFLHLNAR
jgi:DNA-binding response OmpR family regulator